MSRISFTQCRFHIPSYTHFHDSYFECTPSIDVASYCDSHSSTCFSGSSRSFVDVPNRYRSAYRASYRSVLSFLSSLTGVSLDDLSFSMFCLSNHLYIFVTDRDGNFVSKYRYPHALFAQKR